MATLSEEQFVALVQRSEAEATKDIRAYKTKLALFALLGYAVIFSVLAALIVLVGGTIGLAMLSSSLFLLLVKKKFILVILAAIWTFLKALWVKFDPPTGYTLERKKFPVLFHEIDRLTTELDALKIHQVLLQNNLNAAVVQTPRLGVLGGQRNTLILGLQLLMALPPEQARAVLAHEFGHLSGNHSHFAGWIYRVRLSWHHIMVAFDESNSFGANLMRRFFDWYAPRFSAYSFALARNNEYEADQISAELTSPKIAAEALVNVYTKASFIDRNYWTPYFHKADDIPEPDVMPYAGLAAFLKQAPMDPASLQDLLTKEMSTDTHYADTHPALRDRLKAITTEQIVPCNYEVSAAQAWLSESYQEILEHFDKEWFEANQSRWQNRHEYVTHARKILANGKAVTVDTLDDDQLWELAQASEEFEGDDAALPLFQAFLARQPDSIGAAYYIGRMLATKNDIQAIDHLRRCLENPNTISDAAHWGHRLLMDQGKEKEAQEWWDCALTHNDRFKQMRLERASVASTDAIEPPVISEALLEQVRQQLRDLKCVGAAWLAQKVLSEVHKAPVYILAFKAKGLHLSPDTVTTRVAKGMGVDADIFVVYLSGDTRQLAKKVKKVGMKIL